VIRRHDEFTTPMIYNPLTNAEHRARMTVLGYVE
jgi:hypothetical protein